MKSSKKGLPKIIYSSRGKTLKMKGDKFQKALRNLFNFLESRDVEIIGEFPLEKWRKKCKIPRYGSREENLIGFTSPPP